jgi:hypothetical protein
LATAPQRLTQSLSALNQKLALRVSVRAVRDQIVADPANLFLTFHREARKRLFYPAGQLRSLVTGEPCGLAA